MATTLAMIYPDLFAAVDVHSGLPHGVAQSLPDALGAMRGGTGPLSGAGAARATGRASEVPASTFHGDRDTTVHPSNADRVAAQYAAARKKARDGERSREQRQSHGGARARLPMAMPYKYHASRCEGRAAPGAMADTRRGPRLVRRQCAGKLHRSQGSRCREGNAALLLLPSAGRTQRELRRQLAGVRSKTVSAVNAVCTGRRYGSRGNCRDASELNIGSSGN